MSPHSINLSRHVLYSHVRGKMAGVQTHYGYLLCVVYVGCVRPEYISARNRIVSGNLQSELILLLVYWRNLYKPINMKAAVDVLRTLEELLRRIFSAVDV